MGAIGYALHHHLPDMSQPALRGPERLGDGDRVRLVQPAPGCGGQDDARSVVPFDVRRLMAVRGDPTRADARGIPIQPRGTASGHIVAVEPDPRAVLRERYSRPPAGAQGGRRTTAIAEQRIARRLGMIISDVARSDEVLAGCGGGHRVDATGAASRRRRPVCRGWSGRPPRDW